jgi:signal transduction histidine kinase
VSPGDDSSQLTNTSIYAIVAFVERRGPINGLQQQQLRLIYGASLGMMQLACDMIDSVRGASRLTAERPIEFSIAETFSSVRDIVLPMAEEKGVELDFILPSGDRRKGLQAAINRILLNLTSNAIKFTNTGVVTLAAAEVSGTMIEFRFRIPVEKFRQR